MPASGSRWTVLLLLMLLVTYWALSLDRLTLFPPMSEDEPWLAATSYKMATQGVYGNDLFAGYYGRERHDYNHPPVYILLQALLFRSAGLGVLQMRFLPVACGTLVLALAFAVARQIAGAITGLVAAALLVGLRLAAAGHQSGIPLLDVARVSRYDILVPVFGLTAFWLFNRAERHAGGRDYMLCGLFVGLASLTHLYGAFWLPALALAVVVRRGRRLVRDRAPYLLLAGFALALLPWLAFVASAPGDFAGQMRFVAGRFNLQDPGFYLDNLRHEPGRWHLSLLNGRVRPGAWTALLALLPATLLLLREGGGPAYNSRSFALGAVLSVHALLFAALLQVKLYNYGIALWPLAMLALAWLGVKAWARARRWPWRAALLALLALVLAEGALSLAQRRATAGETASYDTFAAKVAEQIPPASVVLGLQHYWLGLHRFPYRSWLLPVLQADPRYYHEPLPFDQALERVAPDVILVDGHMARYFDELADPRHRNHERWLQYQAYLERHGAFLSAQVEDRTYGRMLIYRLQGMQDGSGQP
jgi:4-amino-4-deoxy-L-arabinose transferase-like glycosyltransferase